MKTIEGRSTWFARCRFRSSIIPIFILLIIFEPEGLLYSMEKELDFLPYGRVIRRIEIRVEKGVSEKSIRGIIKLREGDTFSPKLLRESIELLYKLGKFTGIDVEMKEVEGGIGLIFSLHPAPKVKRIELKGVRSLSEWKVLSFLGLEKGDYYNDDIDELEEKIERRYAENGYPYAKVHGEVKWERKGGVSLILNIEEGEPLRIGRIVIEGEEPLSEKTIKKKLGINEGSIFKPFTIEKRLEYLRPLYEKNGYPDADFELPDYKITPDGREIDLTIRIDKGEFVKFIFRGITKKERKRLIKEMQLPGSGPFDKSKLEGIKRKIISFFQKRGYHRIAVRYDEERTKEGRKVLTYKIKKGRRVIIEEMILKGISESDRQKYEKIVKNSAPLSLKKGFYYRKGIEKGCENIKNYLKNEGYSDPHVQIESEEWTAKGVKIVLNIDKGIRCGIGDVRIEGIEKLDEKVIKGLLNIHPEEPFNMNKIELSKEKITEFYQEQGFFYVSVTWGKSIDEEKKRIDINFFVEEGERIKTGKIIIWGNRWTRKEVIEKELELRTGEFITPSRIEKTRKNLLDTGLFSRIDIELAGREYGMRDVWISVKEKKRFTVEFGGGISSDEGFRLFSEFIYRNIAGGKRQLSFKGQLGLPFQDTGSFTFYPSDRIEDLEEKLLVSYRDSNFPVKRTDGLITLVANEKEKETTYTIYRTGLITGIEASPSSKVKLYLQYHGESRRPDDVEEGAVLSSADEEKRFLNSFDFLTLFDLRDDRFNPKKGFLTSVEIETTDGFISEENFVSLSARNTFYFPLLDWLIFEFTTRGGYAYPFSGSSSIPIEKRFHLGGVNSVRGFLTDSIGPANEEEKEMFEITGSTKWVPVGGNAMLNYMAEIRVAAFSETVELTLFSDGGNVFLTKTESFPDFNGEGDPFLRTSAGFGVRVKTPLGPLKTGYGFNLSRRRDEPDGAFYFSIGTF